MTKAEAPGHRPARKPDDGAAGGGPSDVEAPASSSPATDRVTFSDEAKNDELLCTICGLRACWQEPAAGAQR